MEQPRRVYDKGQFKSSNIYKELQTISLLQETTVIVRGMRCTFYLIGDVAYLIRTYVHKNWKTCNVVDVDKTKFDFSMNSGRIVLENIFASLKNKWQVFKHFNFRIDKSARVGVVCCVLHNYYELWGQTKPWVANLGNYWDLLIGLPSARMPLFRKGK